ncbi:MAG: cytochrome c oxidase subunit 3 [Candidatus Acidiferrales bacterium]|nr:cytochrome c oxidase subunit 3 [Acidobacteriota bacterium]
MAEAHTQAVAGSLWGGGVRPYAMGSKKLGMWLFIIADALTFSILILAYAYIRLASPDWPKPFAFSPAILGATLMTFFLLSSSLTMVMAVAAAHRQEHKRAVRYLLLTMLGGIAFIVLHTREWLHLIHDGVRPFSNPYGAAMFGGTFFGLTGMHMLHVTIGVVYLGIVAYGFGTKKFKSEDIEVCGLYWHFVDLVWMFIFPLVYLLSVQP